MLKNRMTLYIKPTEQCNLKCLHCYNASGDTSSVLEEERLSPFLASMGQYIDKNRQGMFIDVVFHGGEPTLLGVKKLENIYKTIKSSLPFLDMDFSIQTNLLMYNTPLVNFIKKRLNGQVGTSYSPGIRFVNKDKRHEKVWLENIKKCKKDGLDVYLVITLSNDYIRENEPKDLIHFLVDNNIYGFHFEPVTRNGLADKNWNKIAIDTKRYGEWKAEFANYLIESNLYTKFPKNEIVRKAKSFFDGRYIGCSGRDCMLTVMTINSDGTVGTCPNTSKDNPICTLDDNFSDFANSTKRRDMAIRERFQRKECMECEFFPACNGGCCQSKECYESKSFFSVISHHIQHNDSFSNYIKNYIRDEGYCS